MLLLKNCNAQTWKCQHDHDMLIRGEFNKKRRIGTRIHMSPTDRTSRYISVCASWLKNIRIYMKIIHVIFMDYMKYFATLSLNYLAQIDVQNNIWWSYSLLLLCFSFLFLASLATYLLAYFESERMFFLPSFCQRKSLRKGNLRLWYMVLREKNNRIYNFHPPTLRKKKKKTKRSSLEKDHPYFYPFCCWTTILILLLLSIIVSTVIEALVFLIYVPIFSLLLWQLHSFLFAIHSYSSQVFFWLIW